MDEKSIENLLKIVDGLTKQVDGLVKEVAGLVIRIQTLQDLVDKNDDSIRQLVSDQAENVRSLKVGIYGDSKYRITGMVERQEKLELLLREQVEETKSQKDKFRGIQIGVGLAAVAGVGSLTAIIGRFFGL